MESTILDNNNRFLRTTHANDIEITKYLDRDKKQKIGNLGDLSISDTDEFVEAELPLINRVLKYSLCPRLITNVQNGNGK